MSSYSDCLIFLDMEAEKNLDVEALVDQAVAGTERVIL